MPFTVEKHPELPAVIVTLTGSKIVQEMSIGVEQAIEILNTLTSPVYLIMSQIGIKLSIEDIVSAANQGGTSPREAMGHLKVVETLFVTDDGLIRIAVQGMRSATFGSLKVRVFEKLEQALDYCREHIAETMHHDEF